ncbi:hypothetical protein C8R45DRAFT_98627 [Mycena sanguinolenta]|nr:hypothetical protein C8R45DRAFT_98627 [Mycena sanguinolenta]
MVAMMAVQREAKTEDLDRRRKHQRRLHKSLPFFPHHPPPFLRPRSLHLLQVQQKARRQSLLFVRNALFVSSRHSFMQSPPVSATGRPPPPTSHTSSLPLGLIIGGSVGGMVLGALLVTLFFYWRRRAQQKARRSQAQLGSKQDQDAEKGAPLITPFIVPPVPVVPNAKVADWMRRNRHVSVSTISSFSSPTVIESVGERSSISAYSQSSAPRNGMAGHPARPEGPLHPGLDSINE